MKSDAWRNDLHDQLKEIAGREAIVEEIMAKVAIIDVDPVTVAQWARELVYGLAVQGGATSGYASDLATAISKRVLGEAQGRKSSR